VENVFWQLFEWIPKAPLYVRLIIFATVVFPWVWYLFFYRPAARRRKETGGLFKQLLESIPKAPRYVRVGFLAAGVILWFVYVFLYQPPDIVSARQRAERQHAIAFLLGWESIRSLTISGSKNVSIEKIDGYMQQLRIKLDHPPSYYLEDTSDGGARAQEFGERVYGRLEATIDEKTANYFGIARNLLLSISHGKSTKDLESDLKASGIELPPELRKIPETDHLGWANQVADFFATKVHSAEDIAQRQKS
jgi:hypothetical protein